MTQQEYDREKARLYAEWQAELMKLPYGTWTPERKAINAAHDKKLDTLDAKFAKTAK